MGGGGPGCVCLCVCLFVCFLRQEGEVYFPGTGARRKAMERDPKGAGQEASGTDRLFVS